MKKVLAVCVALFGLCGFESLSDQVHNFEVENKSTNSWEIEQSGSVVKALNKDSQMELTFYVDNFMPNSPQCLSNKRIKDIKFEIDIYKKAQKGDSSWSKMVERARIMFSGNGFREEKRVYGSNLIKNSTTVRVDEVVHIGTLQFLAPLTCEKGDNMRMSVSGFTVRGRSLPPLDLVFKLKK